MAEITDTPYLAAHLTAGAFHWTQCALNNQVLLWGYRHLPDPGHQDIAIIAAYADMETVAPRDPQHEEAERTFRALGVTKSLFISGRTLQALVVRSRGDDRRRDIAMIRIGGLGAVPWEPTKNSYITHCFMPMVMAFWGLESSRPSNPSPLHTYG